MNAQEKKNMEIATCHACLLADVMKPCKAGQHCRFEAGLAVKTESVPNLWQIGKAVIFGSAEWFAAIPEVSP